MQRIDDVMEYPIPKIFKDDYEDVGSASQSASENKYEPIKKLEGYISLRNVSFGYSPLAAPLITNPHYQLQASSGLNVFRFMPDGTTHEFMPIYFTDNNADNYITPSYAILTLFYV